MFCRGMKKHGGELLLGKHVERILVEGGKAVGVELRGGDIIRANKAVVSNASVWDTLRLLPEDAVPESYRSKAEGTPANRSFMHLHLGFDATGMDPDIQWHI